jgi:hypothetical protein
VGEIAYLGTKGTGLDIQTIPNQAPLGSGGERILAGVAPFIYESANGNSIYHAGQLRLTRRFRSGLSTNILYTFSKSIDNASTVGGGGGTGVVAQDAFDLAAERGLSSFDARHSLTANWVFSTGQGTRGAGIPKGWLGALRKDWSFSGGVTYRSGMPLTATVLGNRADVSGTGVTGSNRADATGLPIDAGGGLFDLAAFTVPPATRFGNAGRDTIPGPSLFGLNASLARSFTLSEKKILELRLDANNVLNHVTITRWGTVVNSSSYGLESAAGAMRSMTANVRFRF